MALGRVADVEARQQAEAGLERQRIILVLLGAALQGDQPSPALNMATGEIVED